VWFIESKIRFGPTTFFAMLAAVLAAALLLVFPARALAEPAELSITKEGPSRVVEPGERFDYVLTVSNAAEAQPAATVEVRDELPAGVTFVEAKAPAGVTCPDAADADGILTCTVPNLAAGESKTITLTVEAPTEAGVIKNRATATSPDDDDSPVASEEVSTTVAPNLLIDKLDDPDPVRTEGVLLYTLKVQNDGEGPASGVAVTDELPLDVVDFVEVESRTFDCKYTAGVVQCTGGFLGPGEIAKVVIAVEPEKAGTIQNTAAVFVEGVREPLATDTEQTVVKGDGGDDPDNPDNPDNPDDPDNPDNPTGPDVPQGDQCSPVVEAGTDKPVGVLSGTDPVEATFTNTYNDTLPLRIAYATSSEDGSLTITLTRKDNGKTILDETINGKKRGVLEVDTEPGVSYDFVLLPDNQGYAVQLQIGSGEEPCVDPEDLDPPGGPAGGNDPGNGGNGGNGTGNDTGDGADDVIDDTVSNNPLPSTGGASLLGLAVVSLGLAVVGGATVVRTGVRRRDR
jgi:uncharacterized repeat protein (TIGR01451 family)